MAELACFKAYDLRGRIPEELNEEIAYRVGRAFVEFTRAKKVVVGHDIRLSSPDICQAVVRGLRDQGANIYHIGESVEPRKFTFRPLILIWMVGLWLRRVIILRITME